MADQIVLERYNSPNWIFTFDQEHDGFIYKGRKYLYKLFFESPANNCKPFWIGQLMENRIWVTAEKEIKARRLSFFGSHIVFTEEESDEE